MTKRRPMAARWFAFAALALLAAAAGARAQETVPNVDPAQIRFITPAASSSSCVGKPATPICGIETLIGCASYVWNEACERINKRVYPHARKNVRVEYVIVKAGFVNRDKVRAARKADEAHDIGHWPWLTEDAFQAKVLDRTCPAASASCEGVPWEVGIYTVAPHGRIPEFWSFSQLGIYNPKNWFVN